MFSWEALGLSIHTRLWHVLRTKHTLDSSPTTKTPKNDSERGQEPKASIQSLNPPHPQSLVKHTPVVQRPHPTNSNIQTDNKPVVDLSDTDGDPLSMLQQIGVVFCNPREPTPF